MTVRQSRQITLRNLTIRVSLGVLLIAAIVGVIFMNNWEMDVFSNASLEIYIPFLFHAFPRKASKEESN